MGTHALSDADCEDSPATELGGKATPVRQSPLLDLSNGDDWFSVAALCAIRATGRNRITRGINSFRPLPKGYAGLGRAPWGQPADGEPERGRPLHVRGEMRCAL